MTTTDVFLMVLRAALWKKPLDWKGRSLTHGQYQSLMTLAREQAVTGLVGQALIDSGARLERQDALELFATIQGIRKLNARMDEAVVALCLEMETAGIRIFVFKGQTIAPYYPDAGLRQCGDIDFYCFPEDWERAIEWFRENWQVEPYGLNTEKDVAFTYDGIAYEMHRMLTLFMYPAHSRYWEQTVMGEIRGAETGLNQVGVNGYEIPTLGVTYNVLYVFVHIFQHLISDGIGVRQFCDWARIINENENVNENDNENDNENYSNDRSARSDASHLKDENGGVTMDVQLLQKHLEGIGLRKAFTGLGAILTDYLGLPEEAFPFEITPDDHQKAPALFENMIEMGNFGHNKQYKESRGVRHAMQHLGRISLQARRFYHYAPAEAWWRIPYMFKWWMKKVGMMMKEGRGN